MRASGLAIVLSLVGVFCSSSAFAQRCESLFSSEYALKGRVEVEASALKGPKAEEYAKTLLEIESLLAPLEIPSETSVRIGTAFRASSFNAGDFRVYVGLRPDSMGKMHPKVNQVTLAHEYGHAIFEKNLLKDLESYKNIKQDALTLEKLLEDTIAMVSTRDPKAISDLLTSREKSEKAKEHSSADIIRRDFTDGRHHLNEQRWIKEHPLFSGFLGDVYYAFLPARWELWKITKNKIKSDNYRKALPYKVFSILERNLSESFAKNPDELGNGFKDLKKMNEQIIEDFRREL
ncbi:hypothetical protein [Bdellovibrio bacteriovorus]|uniref:hypothetical protein n=1 Tax=Bdellovibrio bacteriovorus TaxID=959 RepID=UPI0035A911CE